MATAHGVINSQYREHSLRQLKHKQDKVIWFDVIRKKNYVSQFSNSKINLNEELIFDSFSFKVSWNKI